MIYRFLFPNKPEDARSSLLLLAARLIVGALFMSHGIQKITSFHELSGSFPDPLGVGSPLSLSLVIFAELFCSLAFMLGFLYRLSMIPMIVTMIVAFFVIHSADPFAVKELAFLYLSILLLMYMAGPGMFSLDVFIGNIVKRKK